jgi:hypothetical protein
MLSGACNCSLVSIWLDFIERVWAYAKHIFLVFYYCEYCTLLSILIHNDNWSYYRQQQHSSDNEDEKQEKGVYCKINELLFLP